MNDQQIHDSIEALVAESTVSGTIRLEEATTQSPTVNGWKLSG